MLKECTSGPKGHSPGSRPLQGITTFRLFEGISGPKTSVKDTISHSPDFLGIHTLLRGAAQLRCRRAKYVPDARSSNLKLAKMSLASIQLFIPLWMQLNQNCKLTNYFLQLRFTTCTHCAWIKISLCNHYRLFWHLDLRNRIQLEDL